MTPNKAYSNRIFPVALLVITIVLAVGGGAFYWYHTSKGYQLGIQPLPSNVERQERVQSRSDFETVYTELGIQSLPSNVERQERVQSRLARVVNRAIGTQ
jgi:flagellar basal body-associated protein FliL